MSDVTHPARSPDRAYMPQLDALRAFAVLAVLASHFHPSSTFWHYAGPQGVSLFFVLSGFLITGILLECRSLVEETGQPIGATMWRFYGRRALRLLPLLYATLLVAWVLHAREVRESLWWHLGYATNVYFTRTGGWHYPLSHLWSLAVEEQFYAVWPAVILLTPRRRLVPVVVATVVAAPLFRGLGPYLGVSTMAIGTLPFGRVDALGLGSLLALAPAAPAGAWPRWLRLALPPAAVIAAGLLLPTAWTPRPLAWLYAVDFWNTAMAVLFAGAVLGASRGWSGPLGRALAWEPLVYVGRISYGIYVLHLFVQLAVGNVGRALGAPWDAAVPWPGHEGIRFVALTAITIAAAAVSWHFYERPLNALKRYLPYRVRPRVPAGDVAVATPGHAP